MNTDTNMQFTDEIYSHLFSFLRDIAALRPTLGCIYMRGERAYAADGYALFDFPLAAIDLNDWLQEHCYRWEEMGNNAPNDFYMDFDDTYDDMIPNLKKLGVLLPCATAMIDEKTKAFPDPDKIRISDWQDLGELDTAELAMLCYRSKQVWLGKGLAAMTVPLANETFVTKNIEAAINFPLILQSKTVKLEVSHNADGGHAIRLSANDAHIWIMGYLGDSTPLE